MTAEVAIINHQGIALAADSAVTIGRKRVWKHANKLFSAGPRNDIGVMIFNSGDFLGITWEVIIKKHRRKRAIATFDTVELFAQDLIEYLSSSDLANDMQEKTSIHLICIDILENLKEKIRCDTRKNFYAELPRAVDSELEGLDHAEFLSGSESSADFIKKFKSSIKSFSKEIFGFLPKKEILSKIYDLVYKHVTHQSESEYSTGVVIAGYGRDEFFPCVYNYVVDGRWKALTRVWKTDRSVNLNEPNPVAAGIFPFTQSDMAMLFVEGIYPRYKVYLGEALGGILNEKSKKLIENYLPEAERVVEYERQVKDNNLIVEELYKDFDDYRKKSFVSPLMATVAALPKEEMAFMAKAMVELTALRRKFTSNVESVGGAVDVALISKGDGFIWIDRKHYFDIDFNSDFRDRKALSRGGAE